MAAAEQFPFTRSIAWPQFGHNLAAVTVNSREIPGCLFAAETQFKPLTGGAGNTGNHQCPPAPDGSALLEALSLSNVSAD
jgi:hypothetical protein